MREIWLRPNRRALLLGLIPPLALLVLGLACLLWARRFDNPAPVTWLGVAIVGASLISAGTLVYFLGQPRLAYENRELLVFLTASRPIRVPIEVVECFFLGQGPSHMPVTGMAEAESVNVVVRIAEKARLWHRREVKPALGHWCDGYITIRGAWCEPITPPLVARLNHRLVELQRRERDAV